eukprot:TRINITY_DN9605_c0_g2_i1.p1 TRINITY_DN9605_c0_g2~~TRINITY_DN9605_c0_g2_i1.p1  ORF type:complete len:1202 (+),score=251.55 TRINITY_DN9605_c0_g2_i1:125-3730(+)
MVFLISGCDGCFAFFSEASNGSASGGSETGLGDDAVVKNPKKRPSLQLRRPDAIIDCGVARSISTKPCNICGEVCKETTVGDRGTWLCRRCARAQDEDKLASHGDLSLDDHAGLDAVAEVLDEVPWTHWKPGKQPAKILDWLYLGDLYEATDIDKLRRRGVDAVLNLVSWWELVAKLPEDMNLPHYFSEHSIDYNEVDSEDRLFYDMVESSWPEAEQVLKRCHAEGKHVLVNCHAGHNRSACIVVCWLVVHEGMSLCDAISLVLSRRGIILSNHGFRLQLVRLAAALDRVGEPDRARMEEHAARKSIEPETPSASRRTPAEDKAVVHIIKKKRSSAAYDKRTTTRVRKDSSSGGEEAKKPFGSNWLRTVSPFLSQRQIALSLAACLVHPNANFLEDYEYTQDPPVVIGSGFSGDVLLCQRKGKTSTWTHRGKLVFCVKRFTHRCMVPSDCETLQNEASIYLSLEHPHIARLFDVYESKEETSLIMQYCSGGTLEDCVAKNGAFSVEDFQEAALQMLRAVNYIHIRGIVHRDIKPRNWVYESGRRYMKLIDFGFSAQQFLQRAGSEDFIMEATNLTGVLGTLGYLAPEVADSYTSDAAYNQKCDLWAMGVVFLEMLTAEPVFHKQVGACDGYTREVVLRDIQQVSEADVEGFLSRAPDISRPFVRQFLEAEPSKRCSAKEALQHPHLASAREALLHQACALPVAEVCARFRAYGGLSVTTRQSLLAMARAPSRLPWTQFCQIRATFDLFDQRELNGTIDIDSFLAVVTAGDEDISPNEVSLDDAQTIWEGVCGQELSMSYCEFLAALMPPVEDAFEDVSPRTLVGSEEDTEASTLVLSTRMSDSVTWDVNAPVCRYLPLLTSSKKCLAELTFNEATPVLDVVNVMEEKSSRWALVRYKNGSHQFFDYSDITRYIVRETRQTTADRIKAVGERLGKLRVGAIAGSSGYSVFSPVAMETPMRDVLLLLASASGCKGREKRAKCGRHRVPITDKGGNILRVFSSMDFLELALHFPNPAATLRSRAATVFDRRDDILGVSVPHNDTFLNALRIMDEEKLTVCPATSEELSGDLGGAVAVGVVSVTDLKAVVTSGQSDVLDRSVDEFIEWRRHEFAEAPAERFNVASVDRTETVHTLAHRLLTSKRPRVFLSSEELARIVGIVSARDILVEVLDDIMQTGRFQSKQPFSSAPSPQKQTFFPCATTTS